MGQTIGICNKSGYQGTMLNRGENVTCQVIIQLPEVKGEGRKEGECNYKMVPQRIFLDSTFLSFSCSGGDINLHI